MFVAFIALAFVAACGTSDSRSGSLLSDGGGFDAHETDTGAEDDAPGVGDAIDADGEDVREDADLLEDVTVDEPDAGADAAGDTSTGCADGDSRCAGDEVLVCDRGVWVGADLCTGGTVCVSDASGAQCLEPRCEPGTTWCLDATTRVTCVDEGFDVEQVSCGDAAWCEDGACVPMICEPGHRACVGDDAVDVCEPDGRFVRRTPCDEVPGCDVELDGSGCSCRDGVCQPWLCEPGSFRCAPDDPLLQSFEICEPHGMGWAATDRLRPCGGLQVCNTETVRCDWIVCTSGDVGCSDDRSQVRDCVDWPPRWETRATCDLVAERCVETDAGDDASCVDWTCLPGTSRCVDDAGDVTELCRDGDGWSRVTCAALGGDACIDGACIADECRFGPSCGGMGRYVQTCNEDTGLRDRIDCGFSRRCDIDALTCRRPVCDADDPSTCRDNEVRRCDLTPDGYGFGYVEEPCEWGCADDVCGTLHNRCHDDADCGEHRCSGGFAVEIVDGRRLPAGHCMPDSWGWVPRRYRTRDNWLGVSADLALVTPADADETPDARVELTSGYLVDRAETTVTEWTALMGSAPPPDPHEASCPTCPVGMITPWSAMAYANARSAAEGLAACYVLNSCTGSAAAGDLICASTLVAGDLDSVVACEGWRLPTEVEWELAATDSATQWTPIGNIDTSPCELPRTLPLTGWQCWNSGGVTRPVRTHPTDETVHGLFDTTGNVSEWVHTSAVGGPSEFAEATDPILPFGDAVDTAWLGLRGWNYAGLWTGIEAWRRQVLDGTVPLAHPAIGVRLVRTFEP